jgi:HTH-type transcriptional repressor of NAD biosynthesis genes
MYNFGVIAGKFQPLTRGHVYLIGEALRQARHVTVMVVDQRQELTRFPAEHRANWIREQFKFDAVRVVVVPDIYNDDDSQKWADFTNMLGVFPDVVFSSEPYGDLWAEALNCAHVCVDLERTNVPISATAFRETQDLSLLPPVTRADYVKRICVVGAESTGTTTLTKELAHEYQELIWVPEYGRLRDEFSVRHHNKPATWEYDDFMFTAVMQQVMEDRNARGARKVLFCDTDALATYLWYWRYHPDDFETARADALLEIGMRRNYDLYIITAPHDTYEQDGLRFDPERQAEMHERFKTLLDRLGRAWVQVTGSPATRVTQAISAIRLETGLRRG